MRKSLVLGVVLLAVTALAADKTYQVTGPILEVGGDRLVVQKGKEKWEVYKGAAKVSGGELKVGAKVTIEYTMNATSIEVKGGDKGEKGEKGERGERGEKGEKSEKGEKKDKK